LIEPSAGSVKWAGPGTGETAHRQAMVFQRPVMLRRSAAANIDYALSLRGLGRNERRARVGEVLEKTGLKDLAGRPARVLSGGEQQRLALARAWALRPEVLFLDEPTANLDPAASRAVERIIDAIHQGGTKIVMTTHDLGQARRLADEVLFIHGGRLTERAAAGQFFEQPQNPAADAFMRGELTW
jgi:tungstate transport system ATP-binding protein